MTLEERVAKLEAVVAGIELHFGQSFAAAAAEMTAPEPAAMTHSDVAAGLGSVGIVPEPFPSVAPGA